MPPGGVADVLTRHRHARHDDTLLTLEINFKEKQPPGSTSLHSGRALCDRLHILAPKLDKLTNRITVCELAGRDLSSLWKLFVILINAPLTFKMSDSNGDVKGSDFRLTSPRLA